MPTASNVQRVVYISIKQKFIFTDWTECFTLEKLSSEIGLLQLNEPSLVTGIL